MSVTFDPQIGAATRWQKGQPSPNPGDRPRKTAPFEVKLQGNRLAITASAAAVDERQVREQADLVARCLAKSLSEKPVL